MTTPIVSIVIATRNRPEKLARLLTCVKEQEFLSYECVVVDDVSSEETIKRYEEIWNRLDDRFHLHFRPVTGGPAQSRNTGICLARGKFIAFCDDDDYWVRTDHLSVAVRALNSSGAELFFANMQTSINGEIREKNWYAQLMEGVTVNSIDGEKDVVFVQKKELANFLKHRIFHANTLVISRDLLKRIGCYWEKISFAEDHDLSFRLADSSARIIFRSVVTADLDVSPHPSIARTYSTEERILFGILAILHAESVIKNPTLRRVARGNRAWRLLELARISIENGQIATAKEFSLQAFLVHPSMSSFRMIMSLLWKQFIL